MNTINAAPPSKHCYYRYWGKYQDAASFHLLPYHCLDVAAVAQAYFDTHPKFCLFLANTLGFNTPELSYSDFKNLAVFFIAMHDLGKFSESFQNLVPTALKTLQNKTSSKAYHQKHDYLGFLLWKEKCWQWLQTQSCWNELNNEGMKFLVRAVFGHHGEPPQEQKEKIITDFFSKDDLSAANEFVLQVGAMFLAKIDFSALQNYDVDDFADAAKHVSWWLAGITVLADWVGSNQEFFPYKSTAIHLEEYWSTAYQQAQSAIKKIQLDCIPTATAKTFQELFGKITPTPLQQTALDLHLNSSLAPATAPITATPQQAIPNANRFSGSAPIDPSSLEFSRGAAEQATGMYIHSLKDCERLRQQSGKPKCDGYNSQHLFIVEDLTGAGKTEAALVLAHKLLHEKLGEGFYFCLPTMATSNAMYSRVTQYFEKLFSNQADVSLILAHSKNKFNSQFQKIINQNVSNFVTAENQKELTTNARCNAWFIDNRKKALLAHFGVGTIDQALQAILPNKHQSLRLLGLFGKVLIVDEVHACDSYMHELLQNLLDFHAASGGSAILLSATLPQKMRRELIKAFCGNKNICGNKNKHSSPEQKNNCASLSTSYPLLTHVSVTQNIATPTIDEIPVATRAESQRTINVELNSNKQEVIERIKCALAADACVCWIRNTVNDAIEIYQELKTIIDTSSMMLFHARFTLGDRNIIEEKILRLFGEKSSIEERRGKLVIATQVVEQSLDIDFDFMVSDLAPIDLLIQRAGRLQRHKRERSMSVTSTLPTLLVYGPLPVQDATHNWYSDFFPKASFVYACHDKLWLTANLIQKHRKFILPNDARLLIESVYGDGIGDGVEGGVNDGIENNVKQIIPIGLEKRTNQAEGKTQGAKSTARLQELNLHKGYMRSNGNTVDWWEDIFATTRLGEKTIAVRLAKWQNQKLTPWHDGDDNAWNLSQVNVREEKISRRKITDNVILEAAIREVESKLPDKGKWSLLLPLEFNAEKNVWHGQAQNAGGKNGEENGGKHVELTYDAEKGLIY